MMTHPQNLAFVFLLVSFLVVEGSWGAKEDQTLRPTRGFEQMRLAVSRNFGKRAIRLKSGPDIDWVVRQQRTNFQDMNLPVARNFGKRSAANAMQLINEFVLDLYDLEAKIKRLRMAQEENDDLPAMMEES